MIVRPWTCLLPLLLTAGLARAQEAGEDLCGVCKTTGRVAIEPRAADLKAEEGALLCSVYMAKDPATLGMDWKVCPDCRAPEAQARARREFDQEFERRRKWLEERRAEVDGNVGHEVDHLETQHFVVAWDIPRIKAGGRVYDRHAAMHLYADRMEALYQQILELHGVTDRATAGTDHYLYFFEALKSVNLLTPALGMGHGPRVSMYAKVSRMATYLDKSQFPKDEDFHQHVCHVVSHHIHNAIQNHDNWMSKRYGWVFEGLAHYIELRNFGPPNTWCHSEVGTGITHWKSKGWEANVKKAVAAGDHVVVSDLMGKAGDMLTPQEHQFAWAYVDYLMWLDPAKMPAFIALLKGPQLPERDALKKVYGISVPEMQEGFEAFVRTEYSAKPRSGPYVRAPRGPTSQDR